METFTRDLLDRAKGLVGGVLRGVHYLDSNHASVEKILNVAGVSHVSLHGVELTTDHGVVSVISSDAFTDGTNELSLVEGPLRDGDSVLEVTGMDDEAPWAALIGRTIVSSRIRWIDSPFVALAKRRKAFSSHHFDVDGAIPFAGPQAPLALELHFDGGGRVLLVSGSWKGFDHPIVETGTGICVLWDATNFSTLVPRIARELKKSW
jgi:hypothetical protein